MTPRLFSAKFTFHQKLNQLQPAFTVVITKIQTHVYSVLEQLSECTLDVKASTTQCIKNMCIQCLEKTGLRNLMITRLNLNQFAKFFSPL